ncbi:MAG: hypothetical protein GXO30_07070, partial [Epsilonproteobacteria bacterium]|nr:hypothetical protein [Campylobacterota bacterium]
VEIKNDECVLHLKAQKSISEILLSKGLAIVKPLFMDDEFKGRFILVQNGAKLQKIGLWNTNIFKECRKGLY